MQTFPKECIYFVSQGGIICLKKKKIYIGLLYNSLLGCAEGKHLWFVFWCLRCERQKEGSHRGRRAHSTTDSCRHFD